MSKKQKMSQQSTKMNHKSAKMSHKSPKLTQQLFLTSAFLIFQLWFKRYDVLEAGFGLSMPFYIGYTPGKLNNTN